MHDPEIIDQLVKLGLSEKEAAVYLTLYTQGRCGGADLIKALGMPRGTVYFLLDSLRSRGLVASLKVRGRLAFHAKPIHLLATELERQLLAVKEQLKLTEMVSVALQSILPVRGGIQSTIESFESTGDIEKMLFNNCDRWHQSMLETDCCWWGFEDTDLSELYPQWFEYIWQRYAEVRRTSLRVRVFLRFLNQKPVRSQFPLTEFRPWPSQIEAFSTHRAMGNYATWLMGDYVVMILTSARPHRAIMIHEPTLAESMRHILMNLWATTGA